jgi:ABC-type sugar transport system ATPase subunit
VIDARKSFGAVRALQGVSVTLFEGEILALLGDNGAGKSTLIKAISGVHQLDAGEIRLAGAAVRIRSPADARELGVETVFQDLAVFDNLEPDANFFIGRELAAPSWLGPLAILRRRAMARQWASEADRLQVSVPPARTQLGLMSGGQRQVVAVGRAVVHASRIVVLDEPTAALGVRESRSVLELVRRLPELGVSVVLVSHNLDHVTQVADRAVVLRQGRAVGEAIPRPENHEQIVALVVGAGAREPPTSDGAGG